MSPEARLPSFNGYGVWAIYNFEIARALRTLWQSLFTPIVSTSLYFVVFGSAIGSRMAAVNGVSYGAFIVPGLIMLALFTESISNASFGIYFPKFTGTIYELLSAPVSYLEIVIALRRRGSNQVDCARPHHSGHGILVRTAQDPAPAVDDRFPHPDRDDL